MPPPPLRHPPRKRRPPTTTEPPRQAFRRRPQESKLTLWEGESALLDCEVDNQAGHVSWMKDKTYLFIENRVRKHANNRTSIPGVESQGNHSLWLERLQVGDSGSYECQVQPDTDERHPSLHMQVELLVLKPPSTQPASPPTMAFNQQQQLAHNLQHQLDNHLQSPPPAHHEYLHKHLQHQQDQLPAAMQTGSISTVLLTPSHSSFTRPHAAASHQPSLQLGLLVAWPYLLLALAVLLLLANLYLIYSLVVRNRRVTKRPLGSPDARCESSSME